MKIICFYICFSFLFLIFFNNNSNVFPQESTINLSNNDGTSYDPQFVISGNNVYVVWTDQSSGNGDIYFKKSSDGGKTFESTINLSNNDGTSYDPQFVISGNNVYVVWTDQSSGNGDIYFKKSSDGGKTFEVTKNLSNGLDGLGKSAIVLSFKNVVLIIWDDDSNLNGGIRLRASLDGGNSFTTSKIISQKGDVNANSPDAFINQINGHLYVVWNDLDKVTNKHNILYRSSIDDKLSEFSNIKTITSSFDNLNNPKFSILEPNSLYIFWEEGILDPITNNISYDIKYKTTTNSELNFSIPHYLIKNPSNSHGVKIENYKTTLYALWKDSTQNSDNLKFKIINPLQPISNISVLKSIPILNITTKNIIIDKDMTISNGTIYILWSHSPTLSNPTNYEIYLSTSPIDKINFNKPVDISNTTGNSTSPLIKLFNNKIFTVWSDNTTGNGDIYFRQLVIK